jgi:hypothetical protein
MFCKEIWGRDFLIDNLQQTYIKTNYQKHREHLLFDRERGMLPATQPYVEQQLQKEAIEKENREITIEVNKLEKKIHENNLLIARINGNQVAVERRKYVSKCPKNDCQGFLSSQLKCELCTSWVCSECREIKGTDRDAEHTCNPEILESVKMLSRDTKPCPKCSTMIHKIEGCDQMFCTECHTPFSWTTLRIETGRIHNPHYFEWQRRQTAANVAERDPNDVLCGRELDHHLTDSILAKHRAIYDQDPNSLSNDDFIGLIRETVMATKAVSATDKQSYLASIMRPALNLTTNAAKKFDYAMAIYTAIKSRMQHNLYKIIMENADVQKHIAMIRRVDIIKNLVQYTTHIQLGEIPNYANGGRLTNNLELRIKYMRNQMTEDDFKTAIQKRDKESQKNTEFSNVLRMYVSCMTDLFYRLNNNVADFDVILSEMHELRKYTNTCIERTIRVYCCSFNHIINEKFEYERLVTAKVKAAREAKRAEYQRRRQQMMGL